MGPTQCVWGGRGTGGNGRGLEEGYATRPPNIPLIPPHTVLFTMVWGGGGQGRVRGRGTVLFGGAKIEDQEIKDPNWLAGFVSGEG